jgi:hypothetical protein
MPGMPITRHAVFGKKGWIAVLIVVVADDGSQEIQFHLMPKRLSRDGIRLLEQAERFYAGREPIPNPVLEKIAKPSAKPHPLMTCIACYTLLRLGRAAECKPLLATLREQFDRLPDTHILAALCEPKKATTHFKRAASLGIPLFTEGFQALLDANRSMPLGLSLAAGRAGRRLIAPSPFAHWIAWQPVLGIHGNTFDKPPFAWRALETHRNSIEANLAAVGLLRGDGPAAGTGFLIAPDLVVTASFLAEALMKPGGNATFSTADNPDQKPRKGIAVKEIVKIDKKSNLAVLRLTKPVKGATPLAIAKAKQAPSVGDKVYIIGYPFQDPRIDPRLTSAVIGEGFGTKRLAPGDLVEVSNARIAYDAFLTAGTAGAPVIALESGLVLGLHHSGTVEQASRLGYATALWKLPKSVNLSGFLTT